MSKKKQKKADELQEKYLKDPNHCPFCGYDGISADHIEADDTKAWRDVECPQCGKSWTEGFELYCVTFDEDDL